MHSFYTLDDVDIQDKRVLLRVDLNVPMKNGVILDTSRIDRIIPTLQELMSEKARIILISHMGRPKGRHDPGTSLAQLVNSFPASTPIDKFVGECVGPMAQVAVANLRFGKIILLENLRFCEGEEANDVEFARQLASLADVYVNDAFSVSHRAHASVDAITKFLPSAMGRLMEAEINALTKGLEHPKRPIMAIVAGAKVSTKLTVLENLVKKVDVLVLGGGIANTFLLAQGTRIGGSLCEESMLPLAKQILAAAEAANCKVLLPTDVRLDSKQIVKLSDIGSNDKIFDIGPETAFEIRRQLESCQTLVWNGPLGIFEQPPFDRGTVEVAEAVAELTKAGKLYSIAGGGETVAALKHAGCAQDLSYLSAAGGAFLEWLEGKTLPGIAALEAA